MSDYKDKFAEIKRVADTYFFDEKYFMAIREYESIFELNDLEMARYALYQIGQCYLETENYYLVISAFTKYSKRFGGIIERRHLNVAEKAYLAMGKEKLAKKCEQRFFTEKGHQYKYVYDKKNIKWNNQTQKTKHTSYQKPYKKSYDKSFKSGAGTVIFEEYHNSGGSPQYKRDARMVRAESANKNKGKSYGSFGGKGIGEGTPEMRYHWRKRH